MAKTQTTALALLFALASPILAQETGDAAETVSEDGLSMGVPADGEGIGKPYVAATFESWEQRCLRTETGVDPCELYYLLKDDQGASVAEYSMFNLPEGSDGPAVAGANVMAPLETLLTAGLSMQVDDQDAKVYPFSVCTPAGCMARLGFTAEEVEAMKLGGEMTIRLVPFMAPDQQVTLKLSLAGFTAGFEAMKAANILVDEAAATTE
jgi:invasion protein IalB